MATRDGAAAIGRDDLGALEPGRWADLVHVDLADPAFVDPADDAQLLSNLVWAGGARLVRDVWVAGEPGAGRRRARPASTAPPRPATSARSPPASTPDPRAGTFWRANARPSSRESAGIGERIHDFGQCGECRSARSAMRKRPEGPSRPRSEHNTASKEGLMELLLQPRRTVQVVGIDDDDDPASPFEVAQPGFVGLDAIDMRGVSVVLDRDTQLPYPRSRRYTSRPSTSRTGRFASRYGKPEVDNQPEQPALRGESARPVARSTSPLPIRVPRGSGRSCSRSRRRRRNAGRSARAAGRGPRRPRPVLWEARQCTAGRRRLVPAQEPGRPCRSSRSSTSAQPLWRMMPSRSPLRCS